MTSCRGLNNLRHLGNSLALPFLRSKKFSGRLGGACYLHLQDLGLLHPEDGGICLLRNVSDHKSARPRTLEDTSLWTLLWESQVSEASASELSLFCVCVCVCVCKAAVHVFETKAFLAAGSTAQNGRRSPVQGTGIWILCRFLRSTVQLGNLSYHCPLCSHPLHSVLWNPW
jgi:hypothetical protein